MDVEPQPETEELRSIETNQIVLGAAVASGPPWIQALRWSSDHFSHGVRPDVVTYNVTMATCEWLQAVRLLEKVMKQETFGQLGWRVALELVGFF